MKFFVTFLKYTGLTLVVLAAIGAVYQVVAANIDQAKFPAPGQIVSVDGLAMHLDCRGTGEPTVILEAGLTSGSASWGLVQDPLAEQTQVCAYDRAGMDWSELGDSNISAPEVAQRLHKLLVKADVAPPYLLVGMSAGGVFVREFYHQHPDAVEGMVLVDSSHEQQGNRLPTEDSLATMNQLLSACQWFQPLGVVRAAGLVSRFVDQYELPQPMQQVMLANMNYSYSCKAMLAESRGFGAEVSDTQPPASLGDLPLSVLTQGIEPTGIAEVGLSDEEAREQRKIWNELQLELTNLSSRGRHLVAERSGHMIHLQQPELIVQEINSMVLQIRDEMPHH